MNTFLKTTSILFLRAVLLVFGIGVFIWLLWEPQLEGRNAGATLFQIYFKDPFLLWAYTGSIAFFVALYQAFKLLGYVARSELFSKRAVKALRTIQYSALTIIAFMMWAEGYLFIVRPEEDIAGGVAMGLFITLISLVVASVAVVLESVLQSVRDRNS